MESCYIKEVRTKKDRVPPIIVNFKHGTLNSNAAGSLICGVYDGLKGQEVAVVETSGDILYSGSDSKSQDLCPMYIGIRNKKTNKIRLIEAKNVVLSPNLTTVEANQPEALDYATANYNLNQAFGSKRSKRVADQRNRMSMNASVVMDKLTEIAAGVNVEEKDLLIMKDESHLRLLPPCHRDAIKPEEVYLIEDILSESELSSLEYFAQKFLNEETVEVPNFKFSPLFECMLPVAKAGSNQSRSIALLLYAESLIYFCNSKVKDFKVGKKVCHFSSLANQRLISDFVVKSMSGWTKPKSMEDKAILHIIILMLHVCGFVFNLDLLTSTIKFGDLKRLKTLVSKLGTVPHPTLKNHIVLMLPLPTLKNEFRLKTPKRRK